MKKFNAVHTRNGRKFILTFEKGKKVVAFDTEKQQEKEICQKTVDRWYKIGKEIKPEPKKKKGTKVKDGRKKMTVAQVKEIREKKLAGQSISSLAREYGMSYSGMYWICKGNTWADLDKEQEQEMKFLKAQEKEIHWYEYIHRGFSIGCQPKGFIKHDDNIGRWGIVAYGRALTAEEMDKFELREYREA